MIHCYLNVKLVGGNNNSVLNLHGNPYKNSNKKYGKEVL